jgi:multidrug resistance efflux pump
MHTAELPEIVGNGFTVMVIVAVVAHCPELGVNVYVVVAVLFMDGAHVPVTELFEVVGKAVNVAPEQMAETCVNVGVTGLFTVINEVRKQPLLLV